MQVVRVRDLFWVSVIQLALCASVFVSCSSSAPNESRSEHADSPSNQISLTETNLSASDLSVEIVQVSNSDDVVADILTQMPVLDLAWGQVLGFFGGASGWNGWASHVYIVPDKPFEPERVNPVRIDANSQSRGVFLFRNEYELVHTVRLIFLLNFEQTPLQGADDTRYFLELTDAKPQETYAIDFFLPRLPSGFHQLSVLVVSDPESTSTDPIYRVMQMSSFIEYRQDMWVGTDSLPQNVPVFDNYDVGSSASRRQSGIEIILPEKESLKPIHKLNLAAGEQRDLRLRVYNCGSEWQKEHPQAYTGVVPVKIMMFWDDIVTQEYTLELTSDAPDSLVLDFNIQAPTQPGTYQLMMVMLPLPGYSQFTNENLRAMDIHPSFSRRVPVDVQP